MSAAAALRVLAQPPSASADSASAARASHLIDFICSVFTSISP